MLNIKIFILLFVMVDGTTSQYDSEAHQRLCYELLQLVCCAARCVVSPCSSYSANTLDFLITHLINLS